MVRRFLSVFLLMGGLLMGSGVNAADLGTYSVDCTTFNQPLVDFVNPQPNDTFTVNITGTCNNTRYIFGATPITTPGDGSYSGSQTFTFTASPAGPTQFLVSNSVNWGTRFRFLLPSPPTVSSVTPTSGSTAGGTSITIAGANFTGATAVSVGGNACTSVSVVSATSITCSTPAGTAGTASVLVTTPGGTNAANTLFTYTAPPTPPQPIPTLSEWAQIMMMLAMIATAGLYGWRMKQR
jgi:hypothetical protein